MMRGAAREKVTREVGNVLSVNVPFRRRFPRPGGAEEIGSLMLQTEPVAIAK